MTYNIWSQRYNTGTSGTCKFLQPKLHQLSIWLTVFYNTFDWQNFSYHQRLGYPRGRAEPDSEKNGSCHIMSQSRSKNCSKWLASAFCCFHWFSLENTMSPGINKNSISDHEFIWILWIHDLIINCYDPSSSVHFFFQINQVAIFFHA